MCIFVFTINKQILMKQLILFLVILVKISYGINLDANTNNSTVNTCSDTLYDSGGPTGNYQSGEDYTITFCSSTAGECPEISFASVALESGYDYVYIYDGTSSSDPLLATVNGSTIPANTIASAGCITIVMHSDGSVQQGGFQLSVNCTANCYVPPPPPTNNGPCSAYTLTVDTVCVTETHTTFGATDSGIPAASCGSNYSGGDVWFEAIVPASGFFAVESFAGSMLDGGIAIYTGPDCNTITEHTCEEAWSGFPGQQLTMASAGLAGQTVWIRIWDPNNDGQGTFNVCAYELHPILDVDTTVYTPTELVEDVLVTGCLQAMNTQFHGPDSAIGYFTNGDIIGMESGLVLSCGKVTDISGIDEFHDSFIGYTTTQPGIASDLLTVANNNSTGVSISSMLDLVVLEFDFIPSSDKVEFEFVFASEEYQAYECTSFNDAFAFFVSGPGISGPYTGGAINVAVVPGTTDPVTVSTINGVATCGPDNSQYYVNNTASSMMNVMGFTTPLTAIIAGLTPSETYHIQFVIGDAGEQMLNSYIFIREFSFISDCTSSINNKNHENIHIYPNPTKDILKVYNPYDKVINYQLVDLNGRIVQSGNIKKGENVLDINKLKNGMYFLSINYYNIVNKIIVN